MRRSACPFFAASGLLCPPLLPPPPPTPPLRRYFGFPPALPPPRLLNACLPTFQRNSRRGESHCSAARASRRAAAPIMPTAASLYLLSIIPCVMCQCVRVREVPMSVSALASLRRTIEYTQRPSQGSPNLVRAFSRPWRGQYIFTLVLYPCKLRNCRSPSFDARPSVRPPIRTPQQRPFFSIPGCFAAEDSADT